MSEKTPKVDPLLADEGQKSPDQPATPKDEAKPVKPVEPAKPPISAAAVSKDVVAQTKAILAKAPHTNFIIPLAEGEQPGAYETVQINGYGLTIKKGTLVNIPMPVAHLLAEKYRIAMEAGRSMRIDRDTKVDEALS